MSLPLAALGRGAVAALPAQLATAPFGVIFGATAIQAGLDVIQTMAMTMVVVAGASQLAATQLMADGAPVWLAIATGAVVNLRMAMYSASIARHWRGASLGARLLGAFNLHDQAFAFSIRRYVERPDEPLSDKLGFYFGVAAVTLTAWLGGCLVGAFAGRSLPDAWALDFAIPITFIAVVAPMLRGAPQIAAAGAAAAGALAFAFLPLGLGLLAGTALGVGAGMAVERMTRRGRAPA